MDITEPGSAESVVRRKIMDLATRDHAAGIVRMTMEQGPDRIMALHVPERHFGASRPVHDGFERAGITVVDLNAAYHTGRQALSLGRHDDAAALMPEIFEGHAIRVVYVTGWGSDPSQADELLRALYPHVSKRPNLRLVAMNNASPVPHMFTAAGPTAHPEAAGFATHLAKLLRIPESSVHVIELTRPDVDEEGDVG